MDIIMEEELLVIGETSQFTMYANVERVTTALLAACGEFS